MSRAYYAMFYLATAMLSTVGQSHRRHGRVVAAFGREFARAGILDARHHAAFREAFDDRAIADYGAVSRVTGQTADARISAAAAFIAVAEAHLRRQEAPSGG